MRHARTVLPAAALLAASLLAGCGRPLFAAEVSVPSVHITSAVQTMDPGVATTDLCALAEACLVGEVQYDLGGEVPFVNEPGVSVDVRLNRFALHLVPLAAGALDGLEFVRVVVIHPASGAPTTVASYTRSGATMPGEILVSGNPSLDLGPYLGGGRIDARLEFGYQLASPPGAFTYQTEADFSVDVIVEYGALL